MNISEAYDNLYMYQHLLSMCEREYSSYVKCGAWSDEVCHRVNLLHMRIEEYKQAITDAKNNLPDY